MNTIVVLVCLIVTSICQAAHEHEIALPTAKMVLDAKDGRAGFASDEELWAVPLTQLYHWYLSPITEYTLNHTEEGNYHMRVARTCYDYLQHHKWEFSADQQAVDIPHLFTNKNFLASVAYAYRTYDPPLPDKFMAMIKKHAVLRESKVFPLITECLLSHPHLLEPLIAAEVPLDQQEEYSGETILIKASKDKSMRADILISSLLERKARIDIRTENNDDALLSALYSDRSREKCNKTRALLADQRIKACIESAPKADTREKSYIGTACFLEDAAERSWIIATLLSHGAQCQLLELQTALERKRDFWPLVPYCSPDELKKFMQNKRSGLLAQADHERLQDHIHVSDPNIPALLRRHMLSHLASIVHGYMGLIQKSTIKEHKEQEESA